VQILENFTGHYPTSIFKERPFRASDKGGTLTKGPVMRPSNRSKWSSDSNTFWSLSRRLLGVERGACAFFQPFHAIYGRGIISECIPVDVDEISFAGIFFEKSSRFRRSEGSLFKGFCPSGEDSVFRDSLIMPVRMATSQKKYKFKPRFRISPR